MGRRTRQHQLTHHAAAEPVRVVTRVTARDTERPEPRRSDRTRSAATGSSWAIQRCISRRSRRAGPEISTSVNAQDAREAGRLPMISSKTSSPACTSPASAARRPSATCARTSCRRMSRSSSRSASRRSASRTTSLAEVYRPLLARHRRFLVRRVASAPRGKPSSARECLTLEPPSGFVTGLS